MGVAKGGLRGRGGWRGAAGGLGEEVLSADDVLDQLPCGRGAEQRLEHLHGNDKHGRQDEDDEEEQEEEEEEEQEE